MFDQIMRDIGVPQYLIGAAKKMNYANSHLIEHRRNLIMSDLGQAKYLAALVKAGVRVGLISKTEEDARLMTEKIKAELEAE